MGALGKGGRDEASSGMGPGEAPGEAGRVPPLEAGSPSDLELVGRVLTRDDRHAFAEIVRRHQSFVRTLLRRLTCGDAALADDLAQESFLRAYRGLARYRGKAKLSSWLYRIAYNVFLGHRGREREPLAPAPLDGVAYTDAAGDRTLLQHDLERAMAALSPPERAALTLAYRDGLSHAEVANVLGCPLDTAKSHILRGREKLERQLSAWMR